MIPPRQTTFSSPAKCDGLQTDSVLLVNFEEVGKDDGLYSLKLNVDSTIKRASGGIASRWAR